VLPEAFAGVGEFWTLISVRGGGILGYQNQQNVNGSLPPLKIFCSNYDVHP
jgi:hypothetical protein